MFLSVTADLAFLEETEEPEGPEEEEERPPPAFRSGGYAGVGGGPDEAGGRFAAAAAVGGGAATAAGSAARRGMSRGRGGVTRSYPLRDVESVETAIETSGWGRGGDDSGVSALLVIQLRGKEEVSRGRETSGLSCERGICLFLPVSPSLCFQRFSCCWLGAQYMCNILRNTRTVCRHLQPESLVYSCRHAVCFLGPFMLLTWDVRRSKPQYTPSPYDTSHRDLRHSRRPCPGR